MPTVINVQFRPVTKLYHFSPGPLLDLTVDDYVIVETSRGQEVAQVVAPPHMIDESEVEQREQFGPTGRLTVAPTPARPGGPPIWIGGSSPAAMRRVVARGDGWLPQGPPPMGTSNAIAMIREERASAGLPAAFDLGVTAGPVFLGEPDFDIEDFAVRGSAERIAEHLRRFPAKGMNQLQVGFRGRDASEVADQVERFGAEVAPLLAG